jgi:dimethylargininase
MADPAGPVVRTGLSHRFARAIARRPGHSVINGLRARDQGAPDFPRFLDEHATYIDALGRAGLAVTVLPALEDYPDSVFVEDAALCFPEGIVMTHPGAPSRTGEAALLADDLEQSGYKVVRNDSGKPIDGGDVLVTDSRVLVGLSERTRPEGYAWLRSILEPWGYAVSAVETPKQVLHLKSDCSVLDGETILVTSRLAGEDCFASYRTITVPRGEEAAANSIRVNETVLVPEGFPATAGLLTGNGYRVKAVPVSQAALLDGGLSCMSLRIPA